MRGHFVFWDINQFRFGYAVRLSGPFVWGVKIARLLKFNFFGAENTIFILVVLVIAQIFSLMMKSWHNDFDGRLY